MLHELSRIFEGFIRNVDGRTGQLLRYWYYKRRFGKCGKNVVIDIGVVFQNPKDILLADNIWIDRYAVLLAGKFKPGQRKFVEKANHHFVGTAGQLILDTGVHIAPFTLLQAHGGLSVGRNVTIASGAKVYTLSHHYKNVTQPHDEKRYSFSSMAEVENQFLICSPVVIKANAAVGLNSVILPGTTLNEGSWVGVLSHVQPGETTPNSVYTSGKANES